MKRLLTVISLSAGFLVLCYCVLSGFRLWSALSRVFIAVISVYAGGLIVALVIYLTVYPARRQQGELPEGDTARAGKKADSSDEESEVS